MIWHDLLLDQAPDRRFAHVEDFGRFLERYLTAHRAFALAIRRNLAMVAQRADPRAGPAVALARRLAGAVEHGRDGLIGHLPRQHGDEGHHIGVDAPAMLADAVPRHPQGRVVAALPPDDQAERVVLDTNNNLLDQRANNSFAGCWRGARAVPGPLEISAECEQAIPVRGAQIVVDHLNGVPPHRAGVIDQGVLPAATLVMVENLIGRRLANIDEGATGQVLRRDLGHRRPPERPRVLSRPAGRCRPPPSEGSEEAGSASPATRAAGVEAAPFPRTDPFGCVARSSSPAPLRRGDSRRDKARSASMRTRTSAKLSTGSRGAETS